MKISKKVFRVIIVAVIVLPIAIILLISPITKYLVEKYDEKYIGRQITMDYPYINPFTGFLYFRNLKIYEQKNDSVFVSVKALKSNIELFKIFSKTYELSELTLEHPYGIILQNKKEFNFNDLIEKFLPKKNTAKNKKPLHLNILNVKINDGEFHYIESVTPINYFIKTVNIQSPGFRWDVDTIPIKFSFSAGIGSGDMNGNVTANIKNNDYRLAIVARKFDLNIIEQYLKDLTNYGSFSANIDADFKSKGNFIDREAVTNSGQLIINDFHFGKNKKEDYASFKKVVLAIKEVSPRRRKYLFDSVSISKPYLKYERYDYLDNIQTIFGKKGSNVKSVAQDAEKFNLIIEIARYIKVVSKNFFSSDYKINRLAVYNANLKFTDYSRSEKFTTNLNPLSIIADSIDKTHKRVEFNMKSDIKPYGKISIALSINPKDSSDFDMVYHFQKIPLTMFNPYIISFTSFPFDRGTININGYWNVRNGNIQSKNHLVIIDPRLSNRIRNQDLKWLPMRLIFAVIRERGNIIDYEIPITGNLKSPRFHFRDAILDGLENMLVKPVTTPYRLEVNNAENEIENFLTIKWDMRKSTLLPNQNKFLKRLAEFLQDNSQSSISIHPQQYSEKEKEHILLFEAKKKYFLESNKINIKSFSKADSEQVVKMAIKDSLFIQYLNKKVNHQMLYTVQDKCEKLIGSERINSKYQSLNRARAKTFIDHFKKQSVNKQVHVFADENVIPYNGFSYYKIKYKGVLPESLLKAYRKMNDLNNESPRKRFKNERKRNKTII